MNNKPPLTEGGRKDVLVRTPLTPRSPRPAPPVPRPAPPTSSPAPSRPAAPSSSSGSRGEQPR